METVCFSETLASTDESTHGVKSHKNIINKRSVYMRSINIWVIILTLCQTFCSEGLGKVKLSGYTPWRRTEWEEVQLLLTSALDGGEWSASRPGRALPPGKCPPVPIVQEAGWAPEPVWTQRLEEKSSASVGDGTPAALYTRGNDPRYPLYRKLGGPQSRSGRRG
jgi:hypothetical protein